jgi:altronate hydrolase
MSRPTLAPGWNGAFDLDHLVVRSHAIDDVAVAVKPLPPGLMLRLGDGEPLTVRDFIPAGHKLAIQDVAQGALVRRYGQIIGLATRPIPAGSHVHMQNLGAHSLGPRSIETVGAVGADIRPIQLSPEPERRTFLGYRRNDGRVGTRNFVAILASVNCASSACRAIVDHFKYGRELAGYPNVDGVIAFPTKGGCGACYGSPGLATLQRTMAGIVNHPNVGAYMILGLGCEVNLPDDLIEATSLRDSERPRVLSIQENGGYRATVERGIEAVRALLPLANEARREDVAASELVVALQCGGSDGWSGVTANPALGWAADELVRQGGTVVLGETPEVYGAEHLLIRRARTAEVAERLLDRIRWWERYTAMFDESLESNPSPGNRAGGLTTISEKSLGAIAKAGSTPLEQVVEYAERVTTRGLVHMDTPGYDPVSVTGQVAGGCTIVCFTTGRGSAFGFKPAPSIKIASNPDLYRRQGPDMDVDAGRMLQGTPLEEVGREIFERIVSAASGEATRSEAAGIGEEEFNPWILGAVV